MRSRFNKAVLVTVWCSAGIVGTAVGQIYPENWAKPWSVEKRGRPAIARGPYVMFGPQRDDGSLLVVRFNGGGHASVTIEFHNEVVIQVDAPATLKFPSELPPIRQEAGDELKVAYEISPPSTWGAVVSHREFFNALFLWMGRRQADVGRIALRDDLLVMLGPALTGPGAPIGLHRSWVDRDPHHPSDPKRLIIECVGSNLVTMRHLKLAVAMAGGDPSVLGLGEDAEEGLVLVARQGGLLLRPVSGSVATQALAWRADDAILSRLQAPGVAAKLEGSFVATDATSVLRIKALSAQGRTSMMSYFLHHPRLYSVAIP